MKLDCKMDAVSKKSYNKRNLDSSSAADNDDDDFSDNDSNYVSYHDMDSADETGQEPSSTGGKSRTGYGGDGKTPTTNKRFQTSSVSRNGGDDDDDDSADGGEVFRNCTKRIKQSVERQPTRRPNPKIFNRNALMARENRKKKKQHLEMLERDVDSLKSENEWLRQKLRKRSGMVHKLRDEGLYLKSIIANKTSIMTLLKTIQGNKIPITSSGLSFVTDETAAAAGKLSPPTSTNCSSPSLTLSSFGDDDEDEKENGTVLRQDPVLSATILMESSHYPYFTDLDEFSFDHQSAANNDVLRLDSWQSLLNDDTPFIKQQPDVASTTTLSKVNHEHNYFNNNFIEQSSMQTDDAAADEPGICLHLSSGRISLEFCSSCHQNSQNAWIEEM